MKDTRTEENDGATPPPSSGDWGQTAPRGAQLLVSVPTWLVERLAEDLAVTYGGETDGYAEALARALIRAGVWS